MTKAILCSDCVTIRTLRSQGEPTTCECGKVTGWWTDPYRGIAKIYAHPEYRHNAWCIGFHNGFLRLAVSEQGMRTPEDWQRYHRDMTEQAVGYVFHTNIRNCWAAPFKPGWTSDVAWATDEEYRLKKEEEAA